MSRIYQVPPPSSSFIAKLNQSSSTHQPSPSSTSSSASISPSVSTSNIPNKTQNFINNHFGAAASNFKSTSLGNYIIIIN